MAINEAFTVLKAAFEQTTIIGWKPLLHLALSFLTLAVITRDTNKWKILALPVTIMWHIAGVTPSTLVYAIASITFVLEILSLQLIGELLTAPTRIKGIKPKKPKEEKIDEPKPK